MKRVTLTRAAAALGAACLLLAPMSLSARADETPLPIYQASGLAQGIVTTFGLKPAIIDPLLQLGTNYTNSTISSGGGGQGHSLAAPIFPGTLIIGALGCPDPIPSPFPDGWVEASYPPTQTCPGEAHTTLTSFPLQTGNPDFDAAMNSFAQFTSLAVGDMRAKANLGTAESSAQTEKYVLQGDSNTPVISIADLKTTNEASGVGKTVQNASTVTAKSISLLGGLIDIGSLRSSSVASSDGTTGTAKGSLTFGDVTVMVNGERHEASIDNEGIHVTDGDLSRQQNLGLTEEVKDLLANAGIELTAAKPANIIDGASGEASVGGLIINIDVTVPAVQIPDEIGGVIAQVINQIPTQCLGDFIPQAPVCFGPGVLPGPGTEGHLSLNIGSTDAFAVGGLGFTTPTIGGCTTCGGGTPPTSTLPNFQNQPPSSAPPAAPPAQQPTGPLQLFGLVARLPAIVLLWLGVGLLLLAVASAFRPSLRHARSS
jgi:hypothetical protein